MSYSYEVMQRTFDLAATMQEGIEHIRTRFAEGRFEEMLHLLQDVTQAFISIQQALHMGSDEITWKCFTDHEERIESGLAQLVLAYEREDWDHAIRALEYEVVPGFIRWKEELERRYHHHVVS